MNNLGVVASKEVVTVLQQLAHKLGTTTAHLWQVLLYQAHLRAIIDIILMSGALFICTALWWLGVSLKKRAPADDSSVAALFLCMIFLYLLTAIMVVFMFPTVITAFFNPSYWALQTILNYT